MGCREVDCAVPLEPAAIGTGRETPGVVIGGDVEGVPEDGKEVTKLAGSRWNHPSSGLLVLKPQMRSHVTDDLGTV